MIDNEILELTKTICRVTQACHGVCNPTNKCNAYKYAKRVIEAGYEPKNEWISVDERLPELEDGRNWGNHRPKSIRVLCVCQQRSGKTFVKEGYYELFSNKPCWRIPGSIDSVTHWMPLPKPPKGE